MGLPCLAPTLPRLIRVLAIPLLGLATTNATAQALLEAPALTDVLTTDGTWAEGDDALGEIYPASAGDTSFTDTVLFSAEAGTTVDVSLQADVPAFAVLVDEAGAGVAASGEGTLTQLGLAFQLTRSGRYRLLLNSFHGQPGSYHATIARRLVTLPFAADGRLETGDPTMEQAVPGNPGDHTFADVFEFRGQAGQVVGVHVTADRALFVVVQQGADQLGMDGRSGFLNEARIAAALPADGVYRVVVNTFEHTTVTYHVDIALQEPVAAPAPESLLALDGQFEASDPTLDSVEPTQFGGYTLPTDTYTLEARDGEAITASVQASQAVLMLLRGPTGSLQGSGGYGCTTASPSFSFVYPATGTYQLLIVACAGDTSPSATYHLDVRPATEAELEALAASLPQDGVLESGVAVDATIPVAERVFRTYRLDVPVDATGLSLEVHSSRDVDLFVRHGRPIINSYGSEPDHRAQSAGGDEALFISPASYPPLAPGPYFIDVATVERGSPVPFSLTATLRAPAHLALAPPVEGSPEEVVVGPGGQILTPGERRHGRIDPAQGSLQVWRVDVPEGARRLEVRTYGTTGRMDLYASPPGRPVPASLGELSGAVYPVRTGNDNERLILDAHSQPPLTTGQYAVVVADLQATVAVDFEIAAAIDAELEAWPTYTPPTAEAWAALTPLQRAIRSTVQITSPLGSGSGTVLTPDGLILTNHHVLGGCELISSRLMGCVGELASDPAGRPALLYIGLGSETDAVAQQYFAAQAIASVAETDLALIQLISDLDGRPISVQLPTIPLGPDLDDVALGDAVAVIGYPGVAGAGGRESLSATRGFVTGITEDLGQRALLNVDAMVNGGNSGGALVNDAGVLVGIPSNSTFDSVRMEKQDYARSLTLLPAEWLALLREHGARLE